MPPGDLRLSMDGHLGEASPEERVARFAHRYALSPRCVAIVTYLGAGLRSKEIAARLDCAHSSVRTHVRRICARLGCAGTQELIAKLFRES
jgi:DNA-binding CsgD family transcriptional regulator